MLGQHLACYEGSNDPQRKIFPFAALRFYESSSACLAHSSIPHAVLVNFLCYF